jgi:hypothetical protein
MHPIPHGPGAHRKDIGSGTRAIGEPQTRAVDVVAIEAHGVGEHLVAYRSIESGSPPRLGPLSTPASASASRYATVIAA